MLNSGQMGFSFLTGKLSSWKEVNAGQSMWRQEKIEYAGRQKWRGNLEEEDGKWGEKEKRGRMGT